MDISLANERAFQLIPQVSFDTARVRVDDKKLNLVPGMVGALLSRPKPEDIRLVSTENRLQPFWLVTASARTRYDRARTYAVPVSGPEVQQVTLFDTQVLPVENKGKGAAFSLNAVENCLDQRRASRTFDGLSGDKVDFARYVSAAASEVTNLEGFGPEGVMVIAPQVKATAAVRQVLAEVIQPVQAQTIHEERVDVENIDLYFRPVYAFEYEWAAKNKRVVVEYDAVTGDTHSGGKTFGEQFKQMKGMITRDLLFDVTADAVGMLVPGGSIAVKLVKAVVDRGK